MHSNPFTYGNPISDPRRFFGREREVEQIFSRLRNEEFESSSVVGDRRIGKTSLLNYQLILASGLRIVSDLIVITSSTSISRWSMNRWVPSNSGVGCCC